MQRLQETFFEEYKRTDALCRELLAAERGVSEYIEQMQAAEAEGKQRVPGWQDDFYALKHLRWLRNQIAHEPGGADCSDADLAQLRSFHQRVLAREDPLALLRQARGSRQPRGPQAGRRAASPAPARPPQSAKASANAGRGAAGQAQPSGRARSSAPPPRRGSAKRARGKRQGPGLRVILCAVVLALLFLGLCGYLLWG